MNLDGALLFLFLAITLPTAPAWFLFRREASHHIVLGLWALGVAGMVAFCANVPFGSVQLGKDTGEILAQFANVFGSFGVLLAFGIGIGAGEFGFNLWKKNNPKPI